MTFNTTASTSDLMDLHSHKLAFSTYTSEPLNRCRQQLRTSLIKPRTSARGVWGSCSPLPGPH